MNEAARILIVEDDPHLLQATSRLLRRAGHEVLEAATGSDALRLSGEQRPDLILLDVVLPDADGVEICRRIKADASLVGSFVVMLSGVETESQNRVAGLEAGADGYIVRPIPNQELLARVQALLRIQQAERALQRAHDDLELRVQQRTIELARMNRALMEEIAQRQLIEQALQRARDELEMRVEERAAELNERVKELGCLYGISHLVESPGVTLGEILQGTAELIPSAWQYPEITGARILLEGQEFSTENFRETAWMQACDIVVRGEPVGRVQVCYVEERPERDEGPFLKEERALLSAIAERLGRVAGRVRAEQALRQSEGLLRTIAANYPAYLSIIEKGEKDLVVGFTSGKQFEKLGLDPRDFVGLTVEQVFGEQAAVVREHYLKAFGGEEVAFQLQVNNQHQSYSAVPLYDEEGRIRRVLAVVEDITERKQAEEALRRRTAELQARNEELDAFAHTVAHDLQNPLGMIIGFADLLKDRFDTLPAEDVAQSLRTIVRSGCKMSDIIRELLLLSSVRGADVDGQPLDMARIVTEVQLRLVSLIQEQQAEIVLPTAWPTALGHAPWVEEVWVNYLSNALKYGGCPPRVELGAAVQAGGSTPPTVRFWIRDNGPGLTPKEQARLFVPFTRLAQAQAKGHGLGLSIVRRIVEKLGGEVGVESTGVPGQGSLFFFTLPAAIEKEEDSLEVVG